MTELEGSLRKLKMIPGRYGTTCKAAVKALHQLGFNDEEELVEAAARGDVDRMKTLMPKADINWRGPDDKAALHRAVEHGHTAAVALLLQKSGIDLYIKDRHGNTTLHHASNKDILVQLLDCAENAGLCKGSNNGFFNSSNYQGHTAFHTFCIANNKVCAEEILRRGLDPNKCGHGGRTCLHMVCEAGHLDIVRLLLTAGGEVNKKSTLGATPLYEAVLAGHTEIVETLLEQNGLDVNATPKTSYGSVAKLADPALCVASKRGDLALVRMLLGDPGVDSISMEAALTGSVECDHETTARLLLGHDAVYLLSPLKSALVAAAKLNNLKMASLLLEHELADSQCIGAPLVAASELGNMEMIQFLLQQDRTEPASCVVAALNKACHGNYVRAVEVLLGTIDINTWTERRMPPRGSTWSYSNCF